VYDKVSRDQIMLDIDVMWVVSSIITILHNILQPIIEINSVWFLFYRFASDSDISFYVSGIPCGIKDFQVMTSSF